MIKVIASDMDGTLLGNDHKVAPETLKAIHAACDAGIRFIIATGRNFRGAMEELKETDIVCDYVVGSGAEVRDQEQRIVSTAPLSMELCEEIYEDLKEFPVSIIFSSGTYDYRIGKKEEIEESFLKQIQLFHEDTGQDADESTILSSPLYQRIVENTKIISQFGELKESQVSVYKVFLYSNDREMLAKISQKLEKNEKLAVASSFPTNLEITAVKAQKGPVLKQYIESLGYRMDEVMVFGDSLNDYSMLSMDFGATVAMENAMPEVKAVSKYITKSNEEFGVAHAIYGVLAQRKENETWMSEA